MRLFSSWPLATFLAGWLALLAPAAHAQHRPAAAGASCLVAGQPLREALTSAGTLRPGATGSFDATGYRLGTDPATGQPVFHPNRVAGAGDENWQDGFGLTNGTNGTVRATVVAPNGDVYVGGFFTTAGGVPANNVAKWNGSVWSALGTGASSTVRALAVSGSDVYVGGDFSTAGGVPASRIAKWNGSAWSALGAGLNNTVNALALIGADVYVGGFFTTAGGAPADRVARWNGSAWSALGTGLNNTVNALALSGTDVYVGGSFTSAGGAPANSVARWNGSAWSALGTGVNSTVNALAVRGADVYVGGIFTTAGGAAANYVARWNGSAWSPLGTGVNNIVHALAVSGSDVYVGGDFTRAGGALIDRVARWNGSAWSALGAGVNSSVYALAVSGADVYVGGAFTSAGGAPANRVARWNGSAWSALAAGLNNTVRALAVSGTDVYVGGDFTSAGGVAANRVVKWNGSAWSALGTGLNSTVNALAVSGTDVYVGGDFTTAGGAPASNIAKWNGTAWSPLGTGLNGTVYALAVSGADVYVGGFFGTAGGAPANNVAKWNGTAWSALGTGLSSVVYALAVSGTDVYVGGGFGTAGGAPASRVAKWNGTAWSALGTGVSNFVLSLAVSGTDVYVGGQFSTAGGAPASRVAKWNGTAWSALGTGLNIAVNALAVSGTDLYVGGQFSTAGGAPASRVAKWNGSAWSALGTGLNNNVYALAVGPSRKLNAGGDFTTVGDGSKETAYFGIYTPNAAPTAVGLSPQSVTENTAGGTAIGTFSSTDADAGDTFTYTLEAGAGDTDNGAFSVNGGGQLVITDAPDYETQSSYDIRVRTTDAGGASFEQIFTISVTDVVEDLVVNTFGQTIAAGTYHDITITGSGEASLTGDIVVTGALVVQANGQLSSSPSSPDTPAAECYVVSGPGSFTLAADANMVICSADGLSASGPTGAVQVTGGRTFSPSAIYLYNGAAAQVTGSGLPSRVLVLYNFGADALTLSQPLEVRLLVAPFADILLNNQQFTLLSDADTTATVGSFSGAGQIVGAATVQQYLTPNPGAAVGYRFLSAPVTTTTVADLAVPGVFTPIVNGAFNAANSPAVKPYPNVFGFDETRGGAAAPFSRGYYSPTPAGQPLSKALTAPLVSGRGYSVAMRATTVDFVGSLTTGAVTVPNLTRTGTPAPGAKPGFHLLGNPFASLISWDDVTPPAGLSPTIYVQKTLGGNSYVYLTRTTTGGGLATGTGTLNNGLLTTAQGFFAQVTGAGPISFTFEEAIREFIPQLPVDHFRAAGRPTPPRTVAAPRPTLALTLRAANAPAEAQDAAFVLVTPGTTPDPALAVGQRPGRNVGVPTLALLTGEGLEQAISSLPEAALTAGTTLELLADLPAAGSYELTVGEWVNLTGTADAVLLDRLTGTRYQPSATVRFAASEAGEVRGRFALVFGQRALSTSNLELLTSNLTAWPNPAHGTVRLSGAPAHAGLVVADLTGRLVARATADATGAAPLNTSALAPGTYVVRAADGRTTRLVVE